jgi:hypothetical protein
VWNLSLSDEQSPTTGGRIGGPGGGFAVRVLFAGVGSDRGDDEHGAVVVPG